MIFENSSDLFTLDDLLIVPQYSDIGSRSQIDLSSSSMPIGMDIPVISSPMDTVTEEEMARAIWRNGGFGILHRFCSIDALKQMIRDLEETDDLFGIAIGIGGDSRERIYEVKDHALVVCIDVAHGHHASVAGMIEHVKSLIPECFVIAGSIATVEGYEFLMSAGADMVRCGVGNGSICSTRLECGVGVPQGWILNEITKRRFVLRETGRETPLLLADGGLRRSGDILKALALGADFVMLGSMLAGTDEAPGDIINSDLGLVKCYRGMASKASQLDFKGSSRSVEGISATVPYKGPVAEILKQIDFNMRSGLSYVGARNLREFFDKARLIRQSTACHTESFTHILNR